MAARIGFAHTLLAWGLGLSCLGAAACKDDDDGDDDGTETEASSGTGTTGDATGSTAGSQSDSDSTATTEATTSPTDTDATQGETGSTGDVPTSCGDGILAPGDVCYGPPTLVSSTPTAALLLRDFDGDGRLDLAAGHDGMVSISLGAGDGSFVGGGTFPASSGVLGLDAGDIDGDGNLDLIVAEAGGDTVAIQLGDGTGGFSLSDAWTDPGAFPRAVRLGQFVGGAALDLVVVGEESGEVVLLQGAGDGTFGAVETIAAGLAPLSVFAAAIDDDGLDDLVVPVFGGASVGLLWGEAAGFSDIDALSTGAGPRAAVAADFDGDDVIDVAVTAQDDDAVMVHAGLGSRVFAPAVAHPIGHGPRGAVIDDVDGDGRSDIFVAVELDNAVGILRTSATGLDPFVSVVTFPRPTAIAVGDLDGDGAPDLVTGNPAADGGIAVNLATP